MQDHPPTRMSTHSHLPAQLQARLLCNLPAISPIRPTAYPSASLTFFSDTHPALSQHAHTSIHPSTCLPSRLSTHQSAHLLVGPSASHRARLSINPLVYQLPCPIANLSGPSLHVSTCVKSHTPSPTCHVALSRRLKGKMDGQAENARDLDLISVSSIFF